MFISLQRCFEDDADKFKDQVVELLNKRDDDGKSPLDIAAQLGRLEITRELITRGADINSFTSKGMHVNTYVYIYFINLLGIL